MPSAWRILNLPYTDATVPPLLLKYEIGAADYSIWITDLTLMWMESLDRKRIIQRSFSIDTSIDPSEGSDQFRLFLQSLESTLEQRPGTTLDLVQDAGDRKLLLQMCTPLPGSLKPLEWFLELALASQSRLTTELVVPMLGQQVIAKLERASLLQQLKEKDQVIMKLVDKMQSDGVDIGRVFPGIASSKPGKQSSRQALGKVVKGLDEFDEQQWRDRLTRNEISPKEYPDLISSAFKNGLPDLSDSSQIPKYNNWWEVLSHRDSQREVPKQICDCKEGDENTSQSEFQRQSTPPKLRLSPLPGYENDGVNKVQREVRLQPEIDSDSTTDGCGDESSTSPPTHSLPVKESAIGSPHVSTSRPQSLNPSIAMSHSTETLPTRSAHQEEHASSLAKDTKGDNDASNSDGGDTDPREDLATDSKPLKSNLPAEASAVPKSKTKLGRIGGRPKSDSNKESDATPPRDTATPFSKLGAQAEVHGYESTKPQRDSVRFGRAGNQPQTPSQPRESSQDRANRKREQLKRELESKRQTGAKKKRKF